MYDNDNEEINPISKVYTLLQIQENPPANQKKQNNKATDSKMSATALMRQMTLARKTIEDMIGVKTHPAYLH